MVTSDALLGLALILVAAKLGGIASARFGLPTVFGQLCAGVLLGPAAFHLLHSSNPLDIASELGAVILMFVAGLETDVAQMRRVGIAAFLSASGGVILPFAAGTALARVFGFALLPSLFVGTLLTATSVSISAQTLQELGRLRSREGTTILGAAVIDDVLGLIVLSLVITVGAGSGSLLPLVRTAAFFPIAIFVGLKIVPILGSWAARLSIEGAGLLMAVIIALVYAWSAESLGNVAAITGAYLAGLVVARTEVASHALDGTKAIGYGLLIPVFFVDVGIQSNFSGLASAPAFISLLIVIAVLTKVVGCAFGAAVGGFNAGAAARVGVGMISRGEVALVVATIGHQAGTIDDGIYAAAVAMTLITTLLTPVLLRLVYANHVEERNQEVVVAPSLFSTVLAEGSE